MPSNDGVAREVQRGRLAGFEDAAEASEVSFTLPPRPGQVSSTGDRGVWVSGRGLPPQTPRASATAPAVPAPAPDPGTKGVESRIRASNVHIPIGLLEPIAEAKRRHGLSNGEVIISAIESTYARLPTLIDPSPTAGGSLFAARQARLSRAGDGPLTPLNYRLREADFTVLDKLVDDLGASSRGHLITVALTAHLNAAS